MKLRYARSRLGQFWLSISFLVMVLSLGVVYTHLWHVDIYTYLPYLAVSQMFWLVISGTITDGCTAFTSMESYLRAEYQHKGVFVLVVIWRQIICLGHNMLVLVPLLLLLGQPLPVTAWLAIPGLVLLLLSMYWVVMALGMLCARFRDAPSLVASVLQILFFITPVMWMPQTISDPVVHFWLVEANPFAAILALLRDPLLGVVPTALQYVNALVVSLLGFVITAWVYVRQHQRLVYWL